MSSNDIRDNEPYTFVLPGYTPDVLLNVFDWEIYAHSTILKLYSAYFRKFMDAPQPPEQVTGSPLYKYFTVVDEDGSWGLEKGQAESIPNKTMRLRENRNPVLERRAFFKLLLAMYTRPYSFDDPENLLDVFRLADFYCALPILSSTLTAALFESDPLITDLETDKFLPKLLVTAKKLRNPLFFRECLVYFVARWNINHYFFHNPLQEADPSLYRVVKNCYGDLCAKILKVDSQVMNMTRKPVTKYRDSDGGSFTTYVISEHWTNLESSDWIHRTSNLVEYYRHIQLECREILGMNIGSGEVGSDSSVWHLFLADIIDPLLKVNLHFPRSHRPLPPLFYCAEIADEDLPWDMSKIDW